MAVVSVLSNLWKVISGFMSGIMQILPKPLKWVIFLLLLVISGGAISDVLVGSFYGCDASCTLVDNKEYTNCVTSFTAGIYWKLNFSQRDCWTMPQADDPDWNRTVCDELIPRVNTVAFIEYTTNALVNLPMRLADWFNEMFFPVANKTYWYDYIGNQGRILCEDLYNCLSPISRVNLNVTPTCTIYKGNTSDDHFPTIDQYTYWTRFNKTGDASLDSMKLFSVQCFDYGSQFGCSPDVAFFGIPILRYEFWVIIAVIGTFLWIISKL